MAILFQSFLATFLLLVHQTSSYSSDPSKPNIVLILADDLGWNDVGYHGASNIETPNIDSLANTGLRLESHYVLPLCSPTRAALLTGRYPIRLGIQSAVFTGTDTYGLSIDQPTIAESLKDNFGYTTHMIGKWHLGYAAWQYTPTYRGFDTFFGFYLGEQDKYTHKYSYNDYEGYDLRDGTEPADMEGKYDGYYSAWCEGNGTIDLLNNVVGKEVSEDPFFMYLAFSTPHKPVEAPEYMIEKYKDSVKQETRQEYSAMVDILDDVIGNIVDEIVKLDMWDNTLIIFMSDNGGERSIGDNFPLCGNKNMLYEGGTRSPTFITGGYLKDSMKGKIIDDASNSIMHVTDWYPTILSILDENYVTGQNNKISKKASILNDDYFGAIDGINQWPFINDENNDQSLRNEFLYNIDPNLCVTTDDTESTVCGAIRSGNYKYILANRNDYTSWNMLWQTGKPSVDCGDAAKQVVKTDISSNRCQGNSVTDGCLFDLSNDPCELFDISDEYPEIAEELHNKLFVYFDIEMNTAMEMMYNKDFDGLSDPNNENNNGFWQPWIDLNDYSNLLNPYMKKMMLKQSSGDNGLIKEKKFNSKLDGVWSKFEINGRLFGISDTLLYLIGLGIILLLGLIFGLITCYKYQKNEKIRKNEEFSPLLTPRSRKNKNIGHSVV